MNTIILSIFLFLSFSGIQENYFDPDGSYSPTVPIIVDKMEIKAFRVSTLEYYSESKFEDDKPLFHKPFVWTILNRIRSASPDSVRSYKVKVSRDSLIYVCSVKKFGVIHFTGTFLDKQGKFWQRFDIKPLKTIVLTGQLDVYRENKLIYSKKHEFTYSY